LDSVFDRGFHLTLQAMRRQLAAMPCDLYLIRLIHYQTRKAFPGERLGTAAQLTHPATVRFLRLRNREGCDVYLQSYAEEYNPGYILIDLDHAPPGILETMRAEGMAPCVVLQTSPGHLQAWVHVRTTPLEPSVASALGRLLARLYHGDLASTDGRHLGRLAGFTTPRSVRTRRPISGRWGAAARYLCAPESCRGELLWNGWYGFNSGLKALRDRSADRQQVR
jgi:RepB DNA-primase from phage plasmid